FSDLADYQLKGGRLVIEGRKLLAFKEVGLRRRDPVLGYAWDPDGLYAIRVNYFDTNLAFGHAKLDELAKSFVRVGKADVDEQEKADMLATFHADPRRAYAYAIQDAVLTLLVHERMAATHRDMYRQLGFEDDIPPLRPTLGRRVADLVVHSIAPAAQGSVV